MSNLGKQWVQDPLIMTPKELTEHVKGAIKNTNYEHADLYTEGKKTRPFSKKISRALRRDVS